MFPTTHSSSVGRANGSLEVGIVHETSRHGVVIDRILVVWNFVAVGRVERERRDVSCTKPTDRPTSETFVSLADMSQWQQQQQQQL